VDATRPSLRGSIGRGRLRLAANHDGIPPPSLSQIWVPGPSRFITPPAAIPGCAVGRPDSPVTHTEIHITAKVPWAASILTQIAIVLKHADASHGRLCQASSGDSRRINATVASSVSDHRQALSTSGWRTLLPCQAAGAFRCVRRGHTALRPHIFIATGIYDHTRWKPGSFCTHQKGNEDLTISEIAARRAASGIKCTGSFRFVISRINATLSH